MSYFINVCGCFYYYNSTHKNFKSKNGFSQHNIHNSLQNLLTFAMKIPTKRNVLIALLMSCKNSLNDFVVEFKGHLTNQLQLLTAVMCMPMFIAVNLDYYGWKYS